MSAQAIIRAFCVDGPLAGMRYLDADTGAVMFIDHPDIAHCFYKLEGTHLTGTQTGGYPLAHFTHLVRHDGTRLFD